MNEIFKAVASGNLKITVVNCSKYYGIQIDNKFRGFITREEYAGGQFICRCFQSLTNGNGWEIWSDDTLHGLINKLIASNNTVYEFENHRDLVKWLLLEKE